MAATLRVSFLALGESGGNGVLQLPSAHSASPLPGVPTDSNLRLFVSRDGSATLSGIQLANRYGRGCRVGGEGGCGAWWWEQGLCSPLTWL